MSGFDAQSVWGAGGLTALLAAIAVPLWRRWLAVQNLELGKSVGEASWQKRQADELENHRQMVTELLKLRTTDAETIASMRLKDAMAQEKIERMTRRMQRMEDALIALKPEFADWIRSDFAELPSFDHFDR